MYFTLQLCSIMHSPKCERNIDTPERHRVSVLWLLFSPLSHTEEKLLDLGPNLGSKTLWSL